MEGGDFVPKQEKQEYMRPSHCGIGACPEVRIYDDGSVLIRSSENTEVVVGFSAQEWFDFKQAIKNGEF